jgi:hypothetical protein
MLIFPALLALQVLPCFFLKWFPDAIFLLLALIFPCAYGFSGAALM